MVVTMPRIAPKLLLLVLAGGFCADAQPTAPSPNAEHLKTGQFVYRTVIHGKDAGNSEISIHKMPGSGNFAYTNRVSGAFSQQWEAILPRASVLSRQTYLWRIRKKRPEFELNYEKGRVTGWASGKGQIDVVVLPDTVDQRIDWAAAMSQIWSLGTNSRSMSLIRSRAPAA